MRRWMEVVAGCYEQVLFGFAVHPEPEADGHREVRARARRDRGWWGGGASGLVPSGLGRQHLRGTHCCVRGSSMNEIKSILRVYT